MRIKCPCCNGKGVSELNSALNMVCGWCMGQGELDLEIVPKEPMTNEEWLNSLALDTKAYWLSCICGRAVWEAKYDNNAEKGTLGYWKEWLKEIHDG